ncbi:MAG: hypothetical protein LUD27_07580 [Clostridia bacterium]|nr:hypothetical protein [Clostridia bacterium]
MDEEITEQITITPHEKQEFDEFKRQKRLTEARAKIRKIELNLTQVQADRAALKRAVKEGEKSGIGGICVQPYLVRPCKEYLGLHSPIAVVASLSLSGSDVTDIKVKQVKRAIKDGADIVEVTACIAAVKEGSFGYIKKEFKKLRKAAKKTALRINVEAPLLTSQELSRICSLACECQISCIRAASDLYGGGADEEDIKIIQAAVKDRAAIKADGVESAAAMASLTDIGVSVIGSSAALTLALNILSSAER